MKLKDLLYELYKQSEGRKIESAIRYAYKYLSYLDEGNETLKTEEVHKLGNERKYILTGNEIVENGIYTLYSGAHDGVEWLWRHDTMGEAIFMQDGWNDVKFNNYDICALFEVK